MSSTLPTILYLCDGEVPECEKTFCAMNGSGECRHTTQWEHALNKGRDISEFTARPGREPGEVNLWEPLDE